MKYLQHWNNINHNNTILPESSLVAFGHFTHAIWNASPSRFSLLSLVIVVVINVIVVFRTKCLFQSPQKTIVIFASRLGTLEKLKSQKVKLVTPFRKITRYLIRPHRKRLVLAVCINELWVIVRFLRKITPPNYTLSLDKSSNSTISPRH